MYKRLGICKKHRKLRIIIISAFILLTVIAALRVYAMIIKTVRIYSQSEVEELASEAMHIAIRDACTDGVEYAELVNIYRTESGKIESLTLNYAEINKLKSDIALKTLEYLNDTDRLQVSIPIGNFTGSELLAGLGPHIKVKVIPNSIADIDFKSTFTKAGINQVRHTVVVHIEVNITLLLPNYDDISTLSTDAIVTEAIIIGDVPDTYLNIGDKNDR